MEQPEEGRWQVDVKSGGLVVVLMFCRSRFSNKSLKTNLVCLVMRRCHLVFRNGTAQLFKIQFAQDF